MAENYVSNKKAFFNYEIIEKYGAGIELLGFEVSAVKKNHVSLEGSFVTIRGEEAFLLGASIIPLQPKNIPESYDPLRNRKLLLTKKEIEELAIIENKKGLTIIPISMYNKNGKIKVEIGIARGKKKFDKRETLKKRESERDIQRALKDL